jgi:hypothetical protein
VNPQVSVIVASLYDDHELARTVKACLEQKEVFIDLIVCIKSSVSSAVILEEYHSEHIVKKVYRSDSGISDSWNFAISIAESDYALFLGRGDGFVSSHSLSNLLHARDAYPKSNFLVLYGNQYISSNGVPFKRFSKPAVGMENKLMTKYMPIPHGSSLWPINLLRFSGFSLKYDISVDYEFGLRWNNMLEYCYVDVDVAYFEPGGLSNSPNRLLSVVLEDCRIKASFFYSPFSGWLVNLKRLLRWLFKA